MSAKFLASSVVVAAAFSTVNAQSSWQDRASSTDPTQECEAYNYQPVDDMMSQFPTIWAIADLSTTQDNDAKTLYAALNASIPDIAPRGTPEGDFSGVNYPDNDPDCWWTDTGCTTPKLANIEADIVKCPEPMTYGLTLDDGPNCSHNAYYDYLNSVNQKATFFYIGSNVLNWPLEAQRALAEGHEICAHTWSHRYMTSLSNEQAFAELYFSKKAIKDVVGVTVQCWRPPYGDVDDRIRYIAKALDMQTIVWNADSNDWAYPQTPLSQIDANYQAVIDQANNGGYNDAGVIVLSHELTNFTMGENMKWLPEIQKTFKQVTPVAVCYNNTNPYVEQEYAYPNFEQWASGVRNGSIQAPTATNVAISVPINSGSTASITDSVPYANPTKTDGISSSSASSSSSGSASSSTGQSGAQASDNSGNSSGGPSARLSVMSALGQVMVVGAAVAVGMVVVW